MLLPAVLVTVTAAERKALKKRICGTRTPWRDRLRAQIVLAAAMGRPTARIARDLRISQDLRRHLPAGTVLDPVSLRERLESRLTDTRKARGKRHLLPSLVSVAAGGTAAGHSGPSAIAQAAEGWDHTFMFLIGESLGRSPGRRKEMTGSGHMVAPTHVRSGRFAVVGTAGPSAAGQREQAVCGGRPQI
ncbi:MAG: hypothetical protein ACRDPY_28510 [Streptosporangiaceae bacterium]